MSETYFRKIVNDVLREDAREEGFQILNRGSQNRGKWEKTLKDVIDNYNKGESGYNVVCMALDFAKYELVKAGIMGQGPNDAFGGSWLTDILDEEND